MSKMIEAKLDANLQQNPELVLVNNGESGKGHVGQVVHFGRVGNHFAWRSFEIKDGKLAIPERGYSGTIFIDNPIEAERLFRRLAASNGFTSVTSQP